MYPSPAASRLLVWAPVKIWHKIQVILACWWEHLEPCLTPSLKHLLLWLFWNPCLPTQALPTWAWETALAQGKVFCTSHEISWFVEFTQTFNHPINLRIDDKIQTSLLLITQLNKLYNSMLSMLCIVLFVPSVPCVILVPLSPLNPFVQLVLFVTSAPLIPLVLFINSETYVSMVLYWYFLLPSVPLILVLTPGNFAPLVKESIKMFCVITSTSHLHLDMVLIIRYQKEKSRLCVLGKLNRYRIICEWKLWHVWTELTTGVRIYVGDALADHFYYYAL